jgi:hypothetical protein
MRLPLHFELLLPEGSGRMRPFGFGGKRWVSRPDLLERHPDLAAVPERRDDMIVKECFGCGNVTAHRHLRDAHEIAETHMAGSERFVCELCGHTTFAGSEGASRFPFAFDKVAAGR